jgi:phosphohistidine phosphatase
MPEWFLMRHAKSDWHANARDDFSRPLNARGQRDARRMGEWLQEQGGRPDLILASPASRARQTAQAVAAAVGLPAAGICYRDALYLAERAMLLAMLQEVEAAGTRVLLVAHNPGLDALVTWLAAAPLARTPSGKLMTTAALAWFSVPAGRLRAGDGRLRALWRPAELA